ncbi:MAG: phosphatase PAP2 family protein [Alphaproteobacteria bacterium]|nr:phosphatase PAP2 family protein [Alphaproteobacteria bacterium SS10]
MSEDAATSPIGKLIAWTRAAPHRKPLIWLSCLIMAHGFAINLYLGLWQYGESGFFPTLNSYTIGAMGLALLILGARRKLKQVDLADALLGLFSLGVLLAFFPAIKSAIPLIVPYYLDPLLIKVDGWLHFGMQPYELVWFVLSIPAFVTLLDIAYYFYFFFVIFAAGFVIFSAPGQKEREAFILAYIGAWYINGCIIATAASSVGPIYLPYFYDGALTAPFEAGLAGLCERSSATCFFRDILLDWHLYGPITDLNGPSAFPSMHISTTFLISLYVHKHSPKFAIVTWVFFAVIMVGSVVLLWHYAIDSYASLITTYVIWWAARRYLSDGQTASQPTPDQA